MDLFTAALIFVASVAAIFAISFAMTLNAKPKGEDLAFFTSSAPDESVIDFRVANACLADAEPNALFNVIMAATGASKSVDPTLHLIKQMSGGLWVGGRVILTTHRVIFTANAMNRAVHTALPVIAFRLSDVSGVTTRFGFVTRIAAIRTPAGTLTVRAFGMNRFAEAIEQARARRTTA